MEQDSVKIVPFSEAHIPELVALHKYCFKEENNISMRLGDAFLQKTYRFFLDDPKSFGYVATHQDKMVGFIMGRLDYYVDALNAYRKQTMIISLISHPAFWFDKDLWERIGSFAKRMLGIGKSTPAPDLNSAPSHIQGKTATLASIAVDPEYTKLKVSDMLVQASVEHVRAQNMLILRAGIARNNMASRFIFSKKGFVEDKVLSVGEGMFYYKKLQ